MKNWNFDGGRRKIRVGTILSKTHNKLTSEKVPLKWEKRKGTKPS